MQDDGGKGTSTIAKLAVCHGCSGTTELVVRLKARGFHLPYSYRTDAGIISPDEIDLDIYRNHTLTALGEGPYPSEIHAKLQSEDFGAKVIKIFNKEIQIGDKAFDDAVWIRTNTELTTRAFLSLSGVQSAIMMLIEMRAEIDIDDEKIYVRANSKQPIDVKPVVLNTAILLHYLTEFASPA